MGKNSSIEWTDHTFNPWWGCLKVSPACTNCYADAWARRVGFDLWGPTKNRRFFGDEHWREPLRWNRAAASAGVRRRVFCASMADVFEDRDELALWRERLWALIEATPRLDWLLLTKRPENAERLAPWRGAWPSNVWLGTTAEDDEWAAKRLPHLLAVQTTVRFLSCEPLLAPITLTPWLQTGKIHWVIVGGESGRHARPIDPEWVRSARDQCLAAAVAFHFKQWGEWGPGPSSRQSKARRRRTLGGPTHTVVARLGKKQAGRRLDGRTWDAFPAGVPDGTSAEEGRRPGGRAGTV